MEDRKAILSREMNESITEWMVEWMNEWSNKRQPDWLNGWNCAERGDVWTEGSTLRERSCVKARINFGEVNQTNQSTYLGPSIFISNFFTLVTINALKPRLKHKDIIFVNGYKYETYYFKTLEDPSFPLTLVPHCIEGVQVLILGGRFKSLYA